MSAGQDASRYAEFTDPRLVAIYDTVNPIDSYRDFYLELVARLAPRTILDIGCGTGLLTCELARRGYHLIGLEPSHGLLDRARHRPDCDGITWIEGDVSELGAVHADLALMTGHVAQFFLEDSDWQSALDKIHDALNPNGHLVFESRNPLAPPFANWPTAVAPQVVTDPVAGTVAWWATTPERDGNRLRYELHYRFPSGEEVVSVNELVFRTQEEIALSLEQAGFTLLSVLGGWDNHQMTPTSAEMIFVVQRV